VAEGSKNVAFLTMLPVWLSNRVVTMRLPTKLHYAWVVAAVTFVVLLLTAACAPRRAF